MTPEKTHLEDTLLFFTLAFLDENLAQRAATRFIQGLHKFEPDTETFESYFVRKTGELWEKYQHKAKSSGLVHESTWAYPPKVDFTLWRQFKKDSKPEEFLTALWCDVLHLTHESVAKGTRSTVGTVRHRLAHATRTLGFVVSKGSQRG